MTAFLGFFFGTVLVYYKTHGARLALWAMMATVWFVAGILIHVGGWEMNKQTWSPRWDRGRGRGSHICTWRAHRHTTPMHTHTVTCL